MNHKRNSFVSGSYVALARAREPGNECVSTILSARFRGGCLRNTIVERKRAGAHHRFPLALRVAGPDGERSAATVIAFARNSMCSSPARHVISIRIVLSDCVPRPVSGSVFTESAVRVLMWKGDGMGRSLNVEREVVMPSSSNFFVIGG